MNRPRILLIDDHCGRDREIRTSYCERWGLADVTGDDLVVPRVRSPIADVVVCSGQEREGDSVINSLRVCAEAVRDGQTSWALVLLDMRFVSGPLDDEGRPKSQNFGDEVFGFEVLKMLRSDYPWLTVVILSAEKRGQFVETALNLGAEEFLSVTGGEGSRHKLEHLIQAHALLEDDRERRPVFYGNQQRRQRIVGSSLAIRAALRKSRRAAAGAPLVGNRQGELTCTLLLGESGSGKELFAQYIHEISGREGFVPVNMKALPETLQERLLLGIGPGVATGVDAGDGYFKQADRGTLFLDEIGSLEPTLQGKLLRVLEDGRVIRVGEQKSTSVDVHVLFATDQNIHDLRRDLSDPFWHRISEFPIEIPPLRDRRSDIPQLVEALIGGLPRSTASPPTLTSQAMNRLTKHDWTGNVRELKLVLKAALRNHPVDLIVPRFLRLDTVEAAERDVTVVDAEPREALSNRLYEIEAVGLERVCEYLEECLVVTRQSNGEVNLRAAADLMVQDGTEWKPANAASLIKRVLHAPQKLIQPVLKDYPVVEEALRKARRVRGAAMPPH